MQITVRDAVKLLKSAEQINILHNELTVCQFKHSASDDIVMDAWGDYVVGEIICYDSEHDKYELILATSPIKRGGNA